jgi:hypothetical protein
MKLECRWCSRWIEDRRHINGSSAFYIHEQVCLQSSESRVAKKLTAAAEEYKAHQLNWSIKMAQRWRGLPGKGWGALDTYPMVEYLGKVVK